MGGLDGGCLDVTYLGFVGEALLGFIGGGKLGGEDFVENCAFCIVCLDGGAGEDAGDEVLLVLYTFSKELRGSE